MINIGIVEDTPSDQASLKNIAEKFFSSHALEAQISIFSSAEEYLASHKKFDLVFLDIMLGKNTGMDLAKEIRASGDFDTVLVFVTSLMNYATEGYEVEAAAYILKPLSEDEFFLKMEWVLKKLQGRKGSKVYLTTDEGIVGVNASDITYVEVYGHYLTYHLADKEYIVRQTLSSALTNLSDYGFFQISKYCLVNMNKIDRIDDNSLFIGKAELTISRSRKQALKKMILTTAD